MTSAHNLLIKLAKARKERDKAKEALSEYFYKNCGTCDVPFHLDDDGNVTACSNYYNISKSCPKGKGYKETWREYHRAAARAGAALRNCLKYGKEAK